MPGPAVLLLQQVLEEVLLLHRGKLIAHVFSPLLSVPAGLGTLISDGSAHMWPQRAIICLIWRCIFNTFCPKACFFRSGPQGV